MSFLFFSFSLLFSFCKIFLFSYDFCVITKVLFDESFSHVLWSMSSENIRTLKKKWKISDFYCSLHQPWSAQVSLEGRVLCHLEVFDSWRQRIEYLMYLCMHVSWLDRLSCRRQYLDVKQILSMIQSQFRMPLLPLPPSSGKRRKPFSIPWSFILCPCR